MESKYIIDKQEGLIKSEKQHSIKAMEVLKIKEDTIKELREQNAKLIKDKETLVENIVNQYGNRIRKTKALLYYIFIFMPIAFALIYLIYFVIDLQNEKLERFKSICTILFPLIIPITIYLLKRYSKKAKDILHRQEQKILNYLVQIKLKKLRIEAETDQNL